MEKTKKWFRLLAFFPIVFVIAFLNIRADPVLIFHNFGETAAEELLAGNEVYFISVNAQGRSCKKTLVENMPKHVDCITVGPSLSWTISTSNVGTNSYYNLSEGQYNYFDYMAIFGLLDYNEIVFDKLILCIDSDFYDEERIDVIRDYNVWIKYSEYMENLLLYNQKASLNDTSGKNFDYYYSIVSQVLSPTYFNSSLSLVRENYKALMKYPLYGTVHDETTASFMHYQTDGSRVYPSEYDKRTAGFIKEQCESYPIEGRFAKGRHMPDFHKSMFIKLIEYLLDKNVKIEFFLCPPAPTLYDRLKNDPDADQYYLYDEIEAFAKELSFQYDIKITGSYNPYDYGIQDGDYYDARHMRPETIDKYFDFIF